MGDDKQSQGRNDNDAIPADEWPSRGVDGEETRKETAPASDPTEQPYAQGDEVEQTERASEATGEVTGEPRSFEGKEAAIPHSDDLEGPAGDPAEGRRSGSDESWPA